MSIIKRIVVLTLLLAVGFAGRATAQEVIPTSGVTVTAARPGKADIPRLRKILNLDAATDQEIADTQSVYVVKVFAHVPQTSAAVALSIGGTPLPLLGTFAGGVFARVYDPAKLRALAGQPVKLYRKGPHGEEPAADAATLPRFPAPPAPAPAAAEPAARKSVDEVLKTN